MKSICNERPIANYEFFVAGECVRFYSNLEMSKHKRFLGDQDSSFNLSENTTPKSTKSCFVSKSDSKIFSEVKGAKRKNSCNNTPDAKQNTEKAKLIYNAPGPSSAKDCHPALIFDSVTPKPGAVTRNASKNVQTVQKTADEKNINCISSTSEVSDFDSDEVETDFFSKFHQKLPYTKQEDELILEYVLKGQNIFKVSSLSLWKYLESKKDNPKRTYQSLKNRFLRNIKPYLFTTYRHLIKNKETVANILLKFPELKKQMGFRDTLSKIDLPTRKSPKPLKTRAQVNNSADEHQENIERTTSEHALKSDDILDPVFQPSQESSQLDPPNNTSFYRKVHFGKKSIFVSVRLTDPNHSDAAISSMMKTSERFKNLRKKRERHFCPACGRYNRNSREGYSSESDVESDSMIPNSVDEGKRSLKNLRKRKFNSNLNNNQKTKRKILSSESSPPNQDSQSLLSYDDEMRDLNESAKNVANSDGSDDSKSFTSKKEAIKVENDIKEVQVQEKSKTVISKKEASLGTEKQWDSESEIDIIYESTMAGFRKLIDADEEKMLFRKCLYKNRDLIGFNSDSEKNVDSYFLESSPEVETPTLTKNSPISSQNDTGKTGFESASSSHLASNMIRMLTKEKSGNKKSQ